MFLYHAKSNNCKQLFLIFIIKKKTITACLELLLFWVESTFRKIKALLMTFDNAFKLLRSFISVFNKSNLRITLYSIITKISLKITFSKPNT